MKRTELYAKVWAAPVRALAQEVGLSDTRVATICKKHGVPLPARGHWAKLAAGKIVDSTPLPQPEIDYEIQVGSADTRHARPAKWVVPGILERTSDMSNDEARPPAASAPTETLSGGSVQPAPKPTRVDAHPLPRTPPDLDLLRAAAQELDRLESIDRLLCKISADALCLPHDALEAVLDWVHGQRQGLSTLDPVPSVIRRVVARARTSQKG